MKINISVEINNQNETEVQSINTCKQYWNLAKAYLPILANDKDMSEIINAIDECKPYCQMKVQGQDNYTIYSFTYNDEQDSALASTSSDAATIASLAAELLGGA